MADFVHEGSGAYERCWKGDSSYILLGDSDRACTPRIAFVLFLDCGRAHREKDLFEMQILDLPNGNQRSRGSDIGISSSQVDNHVCVYKGRCHERYEESPFPKCC